MVRAPMASPILMPSPVQCSPLEVGRCMRSGRYLESRESELTLINTTDRDVVIGYQ